VYTLVSIKPRRRKERNSNHQRSPPSILEKAFKKNDKPPTFPFLFFFPLASSLGHLSEHRFLRPRPEENGHTDDDCQEYQEGYEYETHMGFNGLLEASKSGLIVGVRVAAFSASLGFDVAGLVWVRARMGGFCGRRELDAGFDIVDVGEGDGSQRLDGVDGIGGHFERSIVG
jgi:hypothetical protein